MSTCLNLGDGLYVGKGMCFASSCFIMCVFLLFFFGFLIRS